MTRPPALLKKRRQFLVLKGCSSDIAHKTEKGLIRVDIRNKKEARAAFEEVMAKLEKIPGVTYVGLVPNELGCRRAVLTDIDEILKLIAASETFNMAALELDVKKTLNKALPTILEAAPKGGRENADKKSLCDRYGNHG